MKQIALNPLLLPLKKWERPNLDLPSPAEPDPAPPGFPEG